MPGKLFSICVYACTFAVIYGKMELSLVHVPAMHGKSFEACSLSIWCMKVAHTVSFFFLFYLCADIFTVVIERAVPVRSDQRMKCDKCKRCTSGWCDDVDKYEHAQSSSSCTKDVFFSSALSHVTRILSTANAHYCISFVGDCALPSNTLGAGGGRLGKAWLRAGST